MAKMGRNEPCWCGSGKKFKKCCLSRQRSDASSPSRTEGITLSGEVEKIRRTASAREVVVRPVGVFILFSSGAGDAWLLEASEMDAVQVASYGAELAVEIDEKSQTIEINWSHSFAREKNNFLVTSHKDGRKHIFPQYPVLAIKNALKGIRKRISSTSPHILQSMKIPEDHNASVTALDH